MKEQKDLEMESYVKSRHLSKQFDKRDEEILKEANLEQTETVLALTDDDENNIMVHYIIFIIISKR